MFRQATQDDFSALYQLWMQEHVNPFMIFEMMSPESFIDIYKKMLAESEVYVLEVNGAIVGTQRLIPQFGAYEHVIEYGSFAVDKNHLGKGYGKLFYQFLLETILKTKPHIARIELIQETDNPIAYSLAEKMNFHAEVVFPDWILRETGLEEYRNKWRVGARFMAQIIEPEAESSEQNALPFQQQAPTPYFQNLPTSIRMHDNAVAHLYLDNKLIATCRRKQFGLRLSHIEIWQLQIIENNEELAIEACLRELAVLAAKRCKVVNVFVSDQVSANIMKRLGFHCRGIKSAARKMNHHYVDELGLSTGFFTIEDAKMLALKSPVVNAASRNALLNDLDEYHVAVQQALNQKLIDDYSALYAENLMFEMIRDSCAVA